MTASPPQLTVVIPSYNSAPWLPSTLDALAAAVTAAAVRTEVIVVDDGSTDDTAAVVSSVSKRFPGSVELLRQPNSGRFLARWAGLKRAAAPLVLLLDSRVLLFEDALRHVFAGVASDPARTVWNAHVWTDPTAPLVGFFWDVPTHIFWGGYLRAPRPYILDDDTFDTAPKGTGAFLAPREVLEEAFQLAEPEANAKLVSDDTKVLRHVAHTRGILLDPGFGATYRPRTTVRGFIRHTFDRGTLFVDSYAGTTVVRSTLILLLAVAPVLALAAIVGLLAAGAGGIALGLLAAAVVLALVPLVPAAINRCSRRGLAAYVCCLPLFIAPFWLGLVRGAIIHRRAFTGHRAVPTHEAGGEHT